MADLVIRGMEMPTNVDDCPLNTFGFCNLAHDSNHIYCIGDSRPEWCPLVPLPEGHGNLIDGHKLYRALFATECGNIAADRDSEGWPKVLTYETVKKAIQDATIIVPAEGGTDDG